MPRCINPYKDRGFKWLFGTEKNKAILINRDALAQAVSGLFNKPTVCAIIR